MPNGVSIANAEEDLATLSARVHWSGERIAIQEHGKTIAVMVPASDVEALEALEDDLDARDALEALADYEANGGVSFEDWKANAGP